MKNIQRVAIVAVMAITIAFSAYALRAYGSAQPFVSYGTSPDGTTLYPQTIAVSGELFAAMGGKTTSAIAAGASANTVVKSTPGRLCQVLVTAAGTNPVSVYDNATTASGTLIGYVPANAPAGSRWIFDMPAVNGVTVGGNANNPAMTVSYY